MSSESDATRPDDPMLGTNDAATYLGLSTHTLEVWRREPIRGPRFVRFGKAVRYRRSDLEAYIASSKTEAPT